VNLDELVLANTTLSDDARAHLRRLVASWQILADLCFADLLLAVPVHGEDGRRFVILGQVRPTTGQTLYPVDLVGTVIATSDRPLVGHGWRQGEIVVGGEAALGTTDRARVQCIPVRCRGKLIALLTRESSIEPARRQGELERNYLGAFDRFAVMVAEGSFPFGRDELPFEDTPRVGDGVILVDADLRIGFASPNAVSSLHRMGIHAYTKGLPIREIGFEEGALETALRARLPVDEEMERGAGSFTLRAIPLLDAARAVGVLVLLRDVTDLRSRDRMLLTKDATIREIHHRVKNNLQTIAALLRLQGRRLDSREARDALDDSERRIRSIALVHETLSRDTGEVVPFDDIVRPLVRQVAEAVSSPDRHLEFDVEGEAGELQARVATPLTVALNELMQNAVDHAFGRPDADDDAPASAQVCVRLERAGGALVVEVADDGVGLPPGFSLETSKGLGLSIVEALVTGELDGTMELFGESGTRVRLRVPLDPLVPVEVPVG